MKRRIIAHQVDPADVDKQEFSTDQASVLDELSYLLSTEYEAVKWYDKAIPEIKGSGLDPKIIAELVQGIKEIRKDEEDHIAHIERLTDLVKGVTVVESSKRGEKKSVEAAESGSSSAARLVQNVYDDLYNLENALADLSDEFWDEKPGPNWKYTNNTLGYVTRARNQVEKIEVAEDVEESCKVNADTVKKRNGKWVNRGDDGEEHSEFDTKKEADAQRKAMYASGYKG